MPQADSMKLKNYRLSGPVEDAGNITYAEIPYTHTWNLQADQSSFGFDIVVYWQDFVENGFGFVTDAIPAMMGVSRISDDVTPKLRRKLPWRSAYFPWMWLSSLTNARPQGWKGHKPGTWGGQVCEYDRVVMTTAFVSRPYNVLTDEQIDVDFSGDESQRFVEKLPKPTAEYISILGNSYKFVEGTDPLASATKRFPLATGLITVKVDLEWVWHDVPDQFIMNANGVPTGIIGGLGCVNQNAIWGYPAGTLLALPADITPHEQPVNPLLMGLPFYSPPRSWDVRFRFKFWDPPLTPGATTRGHNTAIWTRTSRFALIKSVNPVGAEKTVYPTYDFTKFFTYRPDNLPANP